VIHDIRYEDVLACCWRFYFLFLPVEGLCFLKIYRLKFGMCVVPDTVACCDVEYWLLRGVLAAKLVD